MVGCFGLIQDGHSSHFPPDRLVENRARIDAFKLNRAGAFAADGVVTQLRWGDRGYRLERQAPNILAGNICVPVVWDLQARPWFLCPRCWRSCKHLYLDEIACRRCCGLDYSSRHLHRSMPGIHRIERWRKLIDADPRPFTPLPHRPPHHVRFHRIAANIIAEEATLVGHLASINRDLDRRIRSRKRLYRW